MIKLVNSGKRMTDSGKWHTFSKKFKTGNLILVSQKDPNSYQIETKQNYVLQTVISLPFGGL